MIDKIINKDYSAIVDLKLAVLEKMGSIDYSVDEAMKMYTKAEALKMVDEMKKMYTVMETEMEEVDGEKFMEVYVKEMIKENPYKLKTGKSDNGMFFIIPMK